MAIAHSRYNDNEYWIAYDGEMTDKQVKRLLDANYASCHDALYEIVREEADATHTNTDEDLEIVSDYQREYEHVELVRVIFDR